ncbi:MAG: hypothetical protein U0929_07280 [Planctomycetaceae bacterium]
MSFVGKILVVVQLVLSVLFMALAGAVFAVHTNWKAKYETQTTALGDAQKDVSNMRAELDSVKQSSQKSVDDAKAQVGQLSEQVQSLTAEMAALRKKNNEDQLELQTQVALAETKAREAVFRATEADEQRAANRALQKALDDVAAQLRQNEDEKFAQKVEYDNLKQQFSIDQVTLAYLKKIVKRHGLETDPKIVNKLAEPPPPVDGLVKDVRLDRANSPKYVEITVGSDDGLMVGHVMDVLRVGVDGKDPQYLGKVRIIDIQPDGAVCEVLDKAKNGIIEVGDNVTTKL